MNPRIPISARVAVRALAEVYPWSIEPDLDLLRALGFLDSPLEAATVLKAGRVLAGLVGALILCCGWVLRGAPVLALIGASATALGIVSTAQHGPVFLAAARRTRALGAASGLVTRAVLRMHLAPSLESGAGFAAHTGTGPLAASLTEHVRRARGTGHAGLDGFASEWQPWFPALPRAVGLLEAATNTPADDRDQTLDRALTTVLDATRDRMAAFAGDVRAPATGLYAFGVLLPLAIAGVFPAARIAGIGLSVEHLVLLYDVLLPATLLGASGWLLLQRPVAFPPPAVDRQHPDIPTTKRRAFVAGGGGIVIGGLSAVTVFPLWTAVIAVPGFGIGAYLVVAAMPIKRVRDHVRAVERDLPDALYLVGQRVTDGASVETAITRVSAEIPGVTGDTLAAADAVGQRLGIGVHASFLGEYGALTHVPSPRARGAAALLALAANEGRPAGQALVAMGSHLGTLQTIEHEARRELAQVTETLANTAALFGPLVAGATVALGDRLAQPGNLSGVQTVTGESAGTLTTAELGVPLGLYALWLAVLLTGLATTLERGFDPALLGYRIGLALLAATATFLAAFVGANLLL